METAGELVGRYKRMFEEWLVSDEGLYALGKVMGGEKADRNSGMFQMFMAGFERGAAAKGDGNVRPLADNELTEERVRSIRPEAVERYLVRQDFTLIGEQRGLAKMYEDANHTILLVPLDNTSNSFANMMFGIAEYFAGDRRSIPDILYAMRHS
jgi:hypothetical protein